MSIVQFLRVLWAHRLIVLGLAAACLTVGVVVVQLVPPRYEAQSRVMLDIIKPDPVTGQVLATSFVRAYTKTQMELVKDPQTAKAVVTDLGWADKPAMQKKYLESKQSDQTDFQRWAAQRIADGAGARLIQGSNILEISYSAETPEVAKTVADALRKAYLETTLQSRRAAATRNAEWYEEQAAKSKAVLFQAETEKSNFEKQTGIILSENNVDIDSARLAALATSGIGGYVPPSAPSSASPAAMQLSRLDSDIAEAGKTLGPNHPQLLQMKRQRELVAKQVADERNVAGSAAAAAAGAAQVTSGLLEAQKSKVVAQRGTVEKLRLMQDEINLRRQQYNNAVARAAQLRQEANVADASATPLANAITPQSPVFPNKPLIIGGATGGGLVLGLLIALLIEMFARRVRSADDLYGAVDAPVLAIIRRDGNKKALLPLRPLSLRLPGRRSKAKMVQV